MLQILLEVNDRYSLGEMAQMAIEAGCGWIQLHCPDAGEDELRLFIPEIVELCRESGTMLTVDDRPEVAREFGMHGVFLHSETKSPLLVRDELGPEAVIGAEIGKAEVAVSLEKADIDYVGLSSRLPLDECAGIITATRNLGAAIPFVAFTDDFADDTLKNILSAGFSGVCIGSALYSTPDPVSTISHIVRTLPTL